MKWLTLRDTFFFSQVHISTNHRAERDAEYQALSKSLGMKSFPESGYGNYESSLNSFVQNSSSLLHQMHQLQGSAGGSVSKFPELSITKHEGSRAGEGAEMSGSSLQIIPKHSHHKPRAAEQEKPNVDIQDQINILRNMPDFMRMNTNTIATEEEDISGEEEEDEEGSPQPAGEGGKVKSLVSSLTGLRNDCVDQGEEIYQAPSLHPDASEEHRLRLSQAGVDTSITTP